MRPRAEDLVGAEILRALLAGRRALRLEDRPVRHHQVRRGRPAPALLQAARPAEGHTKTISFLERAASFWQAALD